MRVICVLVAALSLQALADGGAARTGRTFGSVLGLVGLKPVVRPVTTQALVILQPGQVHTGRPAYHVQKPVYHVQRPVYQVHKPEYNAHKPVYPVPGGPGHDGLLYSWRLPELAGHRFTWSQAYKECEKRNMKLVSIENARKNKLISYRLAVDGIQFIWTSGRLHYSGWTWYGTGRAVGFTNWGRGRNGRPQPDNLEGKEYCLAILNHFYLNDGITWHDIGCHHKKAFICERSYT